MELKNLRTFIYVCENKSYTKAAALLGYTQSTVTAQIKQLEDELGVELFDRKGKNFAINQYGRELLKYAYDITSLEEAGRNALKEKNFETGTIRAAFSNNIPPSLISEMLADFLPGHPDVSITFLRLSPQECMQKLRNNEIDLVFIADLLIHEEDLQMVWMRRIGNRFICSRNHRFAWQRSITPSELAKETLFLQADDTTTRQLLDTNVRIPHFTVRHIQIIDSPEIIVGLVEQGIGVAMLPQPLTRKPVTEGRVAEFMVKDWATVQFFHAIYRKNWHCSPVTEAFIYSARKTYDEHSEGFLSPVLLEEKE